MACQHCIEFEMENASLKRRVAYLENQLLQAAGSLPVLEYPDFCAACGHKHAALTKHHRIPRRLAWKIPVARRVEIIGHGPHVVKLCIACHRHVESVSTTSKAKRIPPPCDLPPAPEAIVTLKKLRDEIRAFEELALTITDEVLAEQSELCVKLTAAMIE